MSHPADAWLPFKGELFFGSLRVKRISHEAKILYVWLLWRQWTHGPLPVEGADVALLCPDFTRRWARLWPEVEQFFPVSENGRVNEHLAWERKLAEERVDNGSEKGRKAAEKRWENARAMHKHSSSTAQVMPGPDGPDVQDRTSSAADAPEPKPRKPATGPSARITQHFVALYESAKPLGYGTKYAFAKAKDGAAVKAMLEAAEGDPEQVCRAITAAFEEPFWFGGGLTLASIRGNYPKFAALASKPNRTARPVTAPVSDAWMAQAREEFARPEPTTGPAIERRKLFENGLRTRGLTREAVLGVQGGAA